MKLAFFSPIKPIKTGIAAYCSELLEYLAPMCEKVHVYVDDCGYPFPEHHEAYQVYHHRLFPAHQQQEPFDAFIYHVGNSPHANYMYPVMLRFPGVIVLHDLHLCHTRTHYYLEHHDPFGYEIELIYNHQDEGIDFKYRLFFSQGDDFILTRYPFTRMHVEASRGILTHSNYGKALAEFYNDKKPVTRVRMHFVDPHPEFDGVPVDSLKAQLRIPEDAFPVIGCFGFIHTLKQPFTTLRAFKRLLGRFPRARLYFIGSPSTDLHLDEEIDRMQLRDHVVVTGWVNDADFHKYIRSVDFAVNLRTPTCGETSAAQVRLMGLGVPTIVNTYRQFTEYPEDLLEVIPLEDNGRGLYAAMERLAADDDYRQQKRERLVAYMDAHHRVEDSARDYYRFLEKTKDARVLPMIARNPEFSHLARDIGNSRHLLDEAGQAMVQDPGLQAFVNFDEVFFDYRDEIRGTNVRLEDL